MKIFHCLKKGKGGSTEREKGMVYFRERNPSLGNSGKECMRGEWKGKLVVFGEMERREDKGQV